MRVRLLRWVSGAYVAVVLTITMWPAPATTDAPEWAQAVLRLLHDAGVPMSFWALEALANVLMFVPFGVLGMLLSRRPAWLVVLAGAGFTTAIELTQLLVPGRVATLQDVVMNTAGAAVGSVSVLAWRAARRAGSGRRRTGHLPYGR